MATIRPNDRVIVIGATGSGKTTLVAFMTRQIQNLAVYDSKRDLQWLPGAVIVTDVNKLTFRRREVFQPPPGMESDLDLFDTFCRRAYAARYVTIWLDEASYVTSPQRMPASLQNILVAGRSLNIGCISLSQSGSGLSNPMLWRTAEHTYVGYGNDITIRTLIPYLGTAVMAATELEQFEGKFLVFVKNAKMPKLQLPIDTHIFGNAYKESSVK